MGLAIVLALATAACGSSAGADAQVASAGGGKASAKDALTKKADAEKAGLDFARCMREHGVDMPDSQAGGGGFIMVGPTDSSDSGPGEPMAGRALPEELAEADEACRHLLDDLIQDGGGPMDAEAQDKALAFAKCMREHGVDMPDPDFSGGGGGFSVRIGRDSGDGGGIDPGSQTFKDAQKACGSLFGPGGPGAGEVVGGTVAGGPGGAGAAVASNGSAS